MASDPIVDLHALAFGVMGATVFVLALADLELALAAALGVVLGTLNAVAGGVTDGE